MILFRPWQAIIFIAIALVIIFFSIPTRRDLGMYYFNSYEYDKAMDYLVAEGKVNSNDVFVLKKLKEYALIQGNVEKAFETQLQLLALKPKNLEYLIEAEKLSDWTNRPHKKVELKEIRAHLVKETNLKEYKALLSEVANGYRYLKDFKSADRAFEELGQYNDKRYLEASIQYFLARKNANEAEELLARYNDIYPNNFIFNNFYFQTLMYQRDYKEAYKILVFSLFPGKNWDTLDQADVALALKNTSREQLKSQKTSFLKLINLSFLVSNERDDQKEGLKSFLTVLEQVENRLDGLGPLLVTFGVKAYREGGENNFTDNMFLKAIDNIGKNYREVYLNIAEFYLSKGRPKEALSSLEALTGRYSLNRRYWEMLAETYQLLGMKEKAIKAFLKLYKLQKRKVDQAYLNEIPKSYFFAQVGEWENPKRFSLPKRRKLNAEELRLLSVEDRLIDSIYSLEDPKEKKNSFEAVLEENPASVKALKGLAYTYYEFEDIDKAHELFERVYQLAPDDKEANQVLVANWIQEGEWKKVEKAMKLFPKKTKKERETFDLTFREYYFEKDLKRYQKFCEDTKDVSSKVDCLLRDKKNKEALELVRVENTRTPKNCEFFVRRLYLETELGDNSWVRDRLKEENQCLQPKARQNIENFVYSQDLFRKSGQFWRYEHSFSYLETNQFSLGEMYVGLMRKLKSWAIHADYTHDKVLHQGSAEFGFVTLGGTYFFENGSGVSAGPTYSVGDKSNEPGVFARYFLNRASFFLNVEYQSKKPMNFTRTLAEESVSFSNGFELYMNYRTENRHWAFITSGIFQEVNLRTDKATYSQITLEGLRRIYSSKRERPWELYTGLQVNNNNLSSATPLIKENFISKSLAVHAVIKAEYNYPDQFMPRKWSGFFRLGVGGDSQRDIDFSKSLQITGQVNKAISKRAKVYLSGEYYSETLGVNQGDTRVIRLGILKDF